MKNKYSENLFMNLTLMTEKYQVCEMSCKSVTAQLIVRVHFKFIYENYIWPYLINYIKIIQQNLLGLTATSGCSYPPMFQTLILSTSYGPVTTQIPCYLEYIAVKS
jgi:hypothetical protein